VLKALTLLIPFHASAHRPPEQPPEKGDGGNIEFVEFTARLCDEQNGVTGKQERGNGKHQPKMF